VVTFHLDSCFAMEQEPLHVRRKKRGRFLDEVQCGGIITTFFLIYSEGTDLKGVQTPFEA
jgi:hypothetical protein